jgi:hypothetical protein
MKHMQDDASKEGNDVDAEADQVFTWQDKWRPKQHLQRGEVHSEKRTCCRLDEAGSFLRPPEPTSHSPPPKPRRSQSMKKTASNS